MQDNIQDLEKKLAEAKKQEYINIRIKEFDSIKKEFEGKCFGSNLFNIMGKSRYFNAVYYEKFFIKNNEIFVVEWIIHGTKYSTLYKSETPAYQISTGIYEKQLTSKDSIINASNTLYSDYNFHRKEISKTEFMSLWIASKECYLVIKEKFKNTPHLEIEDIRQNEYSNDQVIKKAINDLKLDIIDLKDFPKMFWIFEYKSLPMVQNGRYIPRIYAKQILEYVIRELENEKIEHFSTFRIVNWCNERITIIKQFIEEELTINL